MKNKKNIAVLAGWHIQISDQHSGFFLPNVHYRYLKTLSNLANQIILISPITNVRVPGGVQCLLSNVILFPMPNWKNSIDATRYFFYYFKTIKKLNSIDLLYVRVPDPFAWLPSFVFHGSTVMHFVGDTIDATINNSKWSIFKKILMILLYIPEYLLTIIAARRTNVYTNGIHLAKKLRKFGIQAKALISSTLENNDFFLKELSEYTKIVLCYVGYLRYAKGMDIILQIGLKLSEKKIPYIFKIVGNGEMMDEMNRFVKQHKIEKSFIFYGHIDSWYELKKIYRESDLFIFPSRSEGSPRVVLEAISQGLPVISTPVGSLPYIFENNIDISYVKINEADSFISIIEKYIKNKAQFDNQRKNAFYKVCNKYTIDKFLETIINLT